MDLSSRLLQSRTGDRAIRFPPVRSHGWWLPWGFLLNLVLLLFVTGG